MPPWLRDAFRRATSHVKLPVSGDSLVVLSRVARSVRITAMVGSDRVALLRQRHAYAAS